MIAALYVSRKVRTPQSEMPGNSRSGDAFTGNLLDRATETNCLLGDGEMVV